MIEADGNVRLDLLVAQRAELSRNQAATLIANGNVTVNGKREKASYRPVAGDLIVVEIPAPTSRELDGEVDPARRRLRGRRSPGRGQAGGNGGAPRARQLDRNARQRAAWDAAASSAARCAAGARGNRSSSGQGHIGAADRREDRPRAPDSERGDRARAGHPPLCSDDLGPPRRATRLRSTSRSRATRETESAWQSSIREGRRRRTSSGLPASTRGIFCVRICIPDGPIRFAFISRRSAIQ